MNEVFSIQVHNRQFLEQGKQGVWLDLPTTTETLQAALRDVGITADNPQDFYQRVFLPGGQTPCHSL